MRKPDEILLTAAEEALEGNNPFSSSDTEYCQFALQFGLNEKEQAYRLTNWLRMEQAESTGKLSSKELCLFILFVREAAK